MYFSSKRIILLIAFALSFQNGAYAFQWSDETGAIISIDDVARETVSDRYVVYEVTWTAKQSCRQLFSFGKFVTKDGIEVAKSSIQKFDVIAGRKYRDRIPIYVYEKGGDLILDKTSCFNN